MKHSSIAVVAIFLLALLVRLAGIGFGLPHTGCRPDESTIVAAAVNVALGDPNPHFFNYPSLVIYLLAGLYQLFNLAWHATGSDYAGLGRMLELHPAPFFLAARLLSALAGALSTAVLYVLGRELFNRMTGLLAAGFLSIAYLHVRDSHFGATDVPMTGLVLLALLFTVRAARTPHNARSFGLAGLVTGMAVSTKYGALLLPLAMLAALLAGAPDRGAALRCVLGRPAWIYAAGCVAGFLAFTPFALFDAGTFFLHFRSELEHLSAGHTIGETALPAARGWMHHARFTLPEGLGWPLFACGVLGMAAACVASPRRAAVAFVFPLAFYLSAGRGYTVFARYMIPVVPFLCLGAAILLQEVWRRLPPQRTSRFVLSVLALLVALPSLYRTAWFDAMLMRRDNRLVAAEWLNATLPAGSTVYQTGLPWGQVRLQGSRLVAYKRSAVRPDYIVVQRHPLPYSALSEANRALLRDDYREIKSLPALDGPVSPDAFDVLDAFYLPYHPVAGVQRPGPDFHVYQRIER